MGIEADIKKVIQDSLQDIKIELTDEFDRNFQRQAFFSEKWKRRKYDLDPDRAILQKTGALRKSIASVIKDNKIVFTSSLPYAAIHNEGGAIIVTRRMKGFFWHKYKEATAGIKKRTELTTEAIFYKAMALKKVGSKIIIPRRQFIGQAPEMEKVIIEIVEENLSKYFESDQFKINIKK
jgi:Phage virion morphogenesis family.